jgi:hypothetical protein
MAAEFVNRAGRDINVGAQISNRRGSAKVVIGGDLHEASQHQRGELLDMIAELKHAIASAQDRAELSNEAGAIAQYELDTAASELDMAIGGDSSSLLASLKRLRKPLAGAVDLLAKLAAIAAAVQGLR